MRCPRTASSVCSYRRSRIHSSAAERLEIYFHRNSVADGKFDILEVGQEVRFSEALGDKGPQATIVRPVGKHHLE